MRCWSKRYVMFESQNPQLFEGASVEQITVSYADYGGTVDFKIKLRVLIT